MNKWHVGNYFKGGALSIDMQSGCIAYCRRCIYHMSLAKQLSTYHNNTRYIDFRWKV